MHTENTVQKQGGIAVAVPDSTPGVDAVRIVRTGIKLSGEPPAVTTPPPQLGADNAELATAMVADGEADAVVFGRLVVTVVGL